MANSATDTIKRSTLSSVVTERLREMVVQGTYPPGAQLSEAELADRFGTSRGPIREGLQRLVQEGLLRSEPHRGVFMPVISNADIADIYLARETIEAAALQVIASHGERQKIVERLARLVRDMNRAAAGERWSTVADLDMRFHLAVVDAAGSARLSRMYGTLIDETRWLLRMTASYPGREDLVEEHAELARLLDAGDLDGSIAALTQHFALSRRTLMAHSYDASRRDDHPSPAGSGGRS